MSELEMNVMLYSVLKIFEAVQCKPGYKAYNEQINVAINFHSPDGKSPKNQNVKKKTSMKARTRVSYDGLHNI